MPVKEDSKVKVHYTGTLEDGTTFDSSKGRDPLEVELGQGKLIPGFEAGLVGMEKGETKKVTIPSAQAYGEPNPQLVQKVPKDQIKLDQEIKVGMQLMMGTPDGQKIPARVTEVTDSEVTIDINHPLAGKTLNFELEVIDYS